MARNPSKLGFLDGLRGLAAFYVMVGHARWLLWEGYSTGYKLHPERYGFLESALVHALGLFRWGHEAVLFFFVLSGFVIHLREARAVAKDPEAKLAFWPYIRRRARRLYPPLILALVITFALDMLGRRLGLATASGTTPYSLINQNIGRDDSWPTALRNMAFVMDPAFGSDSPLWSLNYEWYFYLLYPAAFLLARRLYGRASLALVVLSGVGFLPGWPRSLVWLRGVFQLMIAWWFGALLAARFAGRFRLSYRVLASLIAAFALVPLFPQSAASRDIVVALGFTGVIAACLALQERDWPLTPLVRLRPLGEMSYTLYVIHFPVLVLLSGLLMASSGGSLPMHLGWIAAGVSLCVGLAWLLHLVVEKPFVSR